MVGMNPDVLEWLLAGDVSIQYQVYRDLLDSPTDVQAELQARIAHEGWGAEFLARRKSDGHWGGGYYRLKWISTHYTLLDLKALGLPRGIKEIEETVNMVLEQEKGGDGGINPAVTVPESDVCVSGMFLQCAAYFGSPEERLQPVIDFILSQQLDDGGFNCNYNRGGAVHSSLHSTISMAEGLWEYNKQGYVYRVEETENARSGCNRFMFDHRLYKSDRTGEVIDKKMLMLSFPPRWRHDILRALDYLAAAGEKYHPAMEDALYVLRQKQLKSGLWPLQAKHSGRVHFDMEKPGRPSRWNTLRALRVLKHFKN